MEILPVAEVPHPRLLPARGTPLTVVFAEMHAIEAVRADETNALPLEPPFHLSDEDAYLVLPDDIGVEIVDILRDGDDELLGEAMRDGLVAWGAVTRRGDGVRELVVERWQRPIEILDGAPDYAAEVPTGPGHEPLLDLSILPHLQCTVVSELFDEAGLRRALATDRFVGVSWDPERNGKAGAEASHAWTRRLPNGDVGVELALFQEYEEMVALLRPVVFTR